MAVNFDAAVSRNLNGVASDSWSHTCTGADRYVVVAVGLSRLTSVSASVTYDGVAMTEIATVTNTGYGSGVHGLARLFGLANPPTGAKTVALTLGSSTFGGAASSSYTGVHQSASVGTPSTANDASVVSTSLTITDGVTGDMILSALSRDADAGVVTASQTQRMNQSGTNYLGGYQDAAGAASVAMQWSWTSPNLPIAHVAIALKQSAGAAQSQAPRSMHQFNQRRR